MSVMLSHNPDQYGGMHVHADFNKACDMIDSTDWDRLITAMTLTCPC